MSKYSNLKGTYQISFDITNRCNLRCLHCYNYSGDNICMNDELSDSEVIKLVNEIIDITPRNVCICGGEPLLRKDLIYEVIGLLKKSNISMSMVSNGLLLDERTVENLKVAGLDRIQISLDGIESSHDRLRNREGAFKKAIKSLDLLKNYEIDRYVSFVPTRWNFKEFDEIVKLSLEKGVKSVQTQYFMPIGRGKENTEEILLNELEYRKFVYNINLVKNRLIEDGLSMTIELLDPIDYFLKMNSDDYVDVQIHIKSNGNVTLSPYLPISFGNVKENKLDDIICEKVLKVKENNFYMNICNKILCIDDLKLESFKLPLNFKEEDIKIE